MLFQVLLLTLGQAPGPRWHFWAVVLPWGLCPALLTPESGSNLSPLGSTAPLGVGWACGGKTLGKIRNF